MDYHRLGLGSASSLVRSVRIADWGAIVLVDCIYDPLGERQEYQLAFRGCSQLRIDMMPDAPVQEQEADLLGFRLGEGKQLARTARRVTPHPSVHRPQQSVDGGRRYDGSRK